MREGAGSARAGTFPALREGRGLGAFNVVLLEHGEAFVAAAEAVRLPVVLQVSQNCVRYHGGAAPLLAATRALLDVACAALDDGSSASQETSIAKTFGAEAIGRVVDRAVQMCGGMGVSADLPVARIAREVRPFRIYDGPSEVHRFAIAKRAVKAARQRVLP